MTIASRLTNVLRAAVGLIGPDSATQAHGLISGLRQQGGAGQDRADRGTQQILEGYSELPWLRAVSQKVSQSVAAVEWQLFAPTRGRPKARTLCKSIGISRGQVRRQLIQRAVDDGDMQPLQKHIMLESMLSANPYMVGTTLFRTTQIHVDLVGEAFWIKDRNILGAPTAFWPIPPHWVQSTPSPGRPFYQMSFRGFQADVPDSEVLWFVDPNPANPYGRGSGIARSLADELETDEYAASFTRMTFLNRARPDLIIWPEDTKDGGGTMTSGQAERLGERWLGSHQGFWNAMLPYFATRKLGVKNISQTFNDLELTKLRTFERNTIIQTWGVPPEELGIIDNSNRATIDAADFLYQRNVIVPRLEFLRMTLQERLVPEYDENLVLDYVNPVHSDRDHELKVAAESPWAQTVDEWRKRQGLDPLVGDAGKMHMVPTTFTPVTDLTTPPPTAAPPTPPTGTQASERATGPLDERSSLRRDARVCAEASDAETAVFLQRAAADDLDDLPLLVATIGKREAETRKWLMGRFKILSESADLDQLERAAREGNEQAALDAVPLDEWTRETEDGLKSRMRTAYMDGARIGAAEADITLIRGGEMPLNVPESHSVIWAESEAAKRIVGISAATAAGIRAAVANAVLAGSSVETLARVIRESIGLDPRRAAAVMAFARRLEESGQYVNNPDGLVRRVSKYAAAQIRARSLLIARTELLTAGNAGQQGMWMEGIKAGLIDKTILVKHWLVTHDERLHFGCEKLGDESVEIDAVFSNGLQHPPDHPACRCAVGLIKKTESSARNVGTQPDVPTDPFDMRAIQRMIEDAVTGGVKAMESSHDDAVRKLQAQLERIESAPRRRTVKSIKRDKQNRIEEIVEREEDDK